MKHYRIFNMLLGHGHSGAKAAEIILDAHRGQKHALQWIRMIRSFR